MLLKKNGECYINISIGYSFKTRDTRFELGFGAGQGMRKEDYKWL